MLRLKGGAPEPIEKGDSDEDFVETNPVRSRKGRKPRKRKVTGKFTKDEAGSGVGVSGESEGDANAKVAFDVYLISIVKMSMMMMMMMMMMLMIKR